MRAPGRRRGRREEAPDQLRDESLDLLVDLARPTSHDAVRLRDRGGHGGESPWRRTWPTVEAVDEQPDLLEEGELATELGLVNVAFALVDLYALPYKDGAFSLIVCHHALHLLPEPVAALVEMQRVLGRRAHRDPRRGCRRGHRPGFQRGRPPAPSRRTGVTSGPDELEAVVRRGWPGRAAARRPAPHRGPGLPAGGRPPPAKAELIRGRFKALPVDAPAGMDVAFADRLVSFSYAVGLRLERA